MALRREAKGLLFFKQPNFANRVTFGRPLPREPARRQTDAGAPATLSHYRDFYTINMQSP